MGKGGEEEEVNDIGTPDNLLLPLLFSDAHTWKPLWQTGSKKNEVTAYSLAGNIYIGDSFLGRHQHQGLRNICFKVPGVHVFLGGEEICGNHRKHRLGIWCPIENLTRMECRSLHGWVAECTNVVYWTV